MYVSELKVQMEKRKKDRSSFLLNTSQKQWTVFLLLGYTHPMVEPPSAPKELNTCRLLLLLAGQWHP